MSISVQVSFRTVVFSGYMNLTETEEIKKMWQEYREEVYKKSLCQITRMVWSLTRARHPGVLSEVGLRKHHYEQSLWR